MQVQVPSPAGLGGMGSAPMGLGGGKLGSKLNLGKPKGATSGRRFSPTGLMPKANSYV